MIRAFGRKILLFLSKTYNNLYTIAPNICKSDEIPRKRPCDILPEIIILPDLQLGLGINESIRVADFLEAGWKSDPEKMKALVEISQDKEVMQRLQNFFAEHRDIISQEVIWLTAITQKSLNSGGKRTMWSTMAMVLLSKHILCEKVQKRLFPSTTYSRPSPFVYMMQ